MPSGKPRLRTWAVLTREWADRRQQVEQQLVGDAARSHRLARSYVAPRARPLDHFPPRRSSAEQPELYRFLDAGDTESFRMRSRPASKKRRGTKSREVGHRRSSECYEVRYEVLDLGNSKSGGLETRGRGKRFGTIVAK
jgi:hypothetical protein